MPSGSSARSVSSTPRCPAPSMSLPARYAALRVNDAEALRRAVIAGLGRSLLPCAVADGDARLRRLGVGRGAPAPARELWLLTHAELRTLGRIASVVAWIEEIAPR